MKTETIEKLKEVLDTAALESYGRNYAKNEGYVLTPGLRDGFYPAGEYKFTTMADAKEKVKGKIDTLTRRMLNAGIGDISYCRFDIEVEDLGNGYFLVTAYYG